MYGLTLWRPWDEAVLGPKDWENRSWEPPTKVIGQHIAIHAGKAYDAECMAFCRRLGFMVSTDSTCAHRAGHVVGVARLVGWATVDGSRRRRGLTPEQVREAERSPWAVGPIAWLLAEKVSIEPVPCHGRQKLWTLPADVERVVRERWEEARATRPSSQRCPTDMSKSRTG